MLVIETVLISEQITQYKFIVLLEINDNFSIKLNVFSNSNLKMWKSSYIHTVPLWK